MLLLIATGFTSCSKDDNEARGNPQVMVINSVEGSSAQNLYLDNDKLNSSAIAYGKASSYLTAAAGTRKAEFRSEGSGTANAAFDLPLQANKNYSVYFAGTTTSSSYLVTEDDLTPPPSGKAKIRFVHLSPAFDSGIDVGIAAGAKVVNDLGYKAASAYSTVNANTTFVLFAAGSANVLLTLPTEIEAGKIYTIYVSGATEATINYHVIIRS